MLNTHKLAKKKKGDDDEVDSGREGLKFIGKVSIVFKDLNDLTTQEEFQASRHTNKRAMCLTISFRRRMSLFTL